MAPAAKQKIRPLAVSELQCSSSSATEEEPATAAATNQNEPPRDRGAAPPPLFLQAWAHHDDASFHRFSDNDEACEIRDQLVAWYRQNRRKLPWRGDPPPWQGSTANFAEKQKRQQQQQQQTKEKNETQQALMTQFFAATATKKESRKAAAPPLELALEAVASEPDFADPQQQQQQQHAYPVTAYGIWVSEIMLQQTRVEAVVIKWCQWMTSFPTVRALAAATPDAVNAHWAGLGFYRRARMLHAAAQQLVASSAASSDGGEDNEDDDEDANLMPTTVEGLMQLPGVGRYTASAIASMAYGTAVPVVDGNVCRVLSRLRGIAQHVKAAPLKDGSKKGGEFDVGSGWDLAAQIVTAKRSSGSSDSNSESAAAASAGEVNQALMELGATYCAPSGTGIDPADPLQQFYWSTRLGQQAAGYFVPNSSSYNGSATATTDDLISSLLEKKQSAASGLNGVETPTTGKRCQVCSANGIQEALINLCTLLDEAKKPLTDDDARICGHRVFPLAPPKAHKKEDVLAVAAISSCQKEDGDSCEYWLLVRRPATGLLAGQWEFPAACVWTSEAAAPAEDGAAHCGEMKKKKGKRQDMSDQVPVVAATVRRKSMQALLKELFSTESSSLLSLNGVGRLRPVGDEPLEHIFSHVRHTMWVEHAVVVDHLPDKLAWVDAKGGREVRWMSETDMQRVGVTSGVKKILKAVHQERSKRGESEPTVSKRKQAVGSKKQAAIPKIKQEANHETKGVTRQASLMSTTKQETDAKPSPHKRRR